MNTSVTSARIPREQCYWAVLDARRLPRRLGKRTKQLDYLFEPLLPVPLDEVHAVYHPLADRRHLACAVDRAILEAHLHRGAVTLTPQALPPMVDDDIDPRWLELLTGPYTAACVSRLRRRALWTIVAAILALTLAISFGLERRAANLASEQREVTGATRAVYREVLGSEMLRSKLPPELMLTAQLRKLRQTRATEEAPPPLDDASSTLAALMGRWPHDLHVQTESLHVTQYVIQINGDVPSSPEAQQLHDALASIEGWRIEHPTVRASAQGFRAAIRLNRERNP